MATLEDNFTGSGVMASRAPDGGGWVPGAVWTKDTVSSTRVVNIAGGKATSESAGGSDYYYPVLAENATIPAPGTTDGYTAVWKPTITGAYSQGTVAFKGPYTELNIFGDPIERYYMYVFWGWPGSFKVGVSGAQRDIKIPPWDDSPGFFGEVAVPSVTIGSSPELKVTLEKTGDVKLYCNNVLVGTFNSGYAYLDPQVTATSVTWSNGDVSLDYFRFGDGGPPPETPAFWTGFNNTYEVL